jgi:hypothetical protein
MRFFYRAAFLFFVLVLALGTLLFVGQAVSTPVGGGNLLGAALLGSLAMVTYRLWQHIRAGRV